MEKTPVSSFRIEFQDCDPFGHLNNVQYVNYILTARGDHLRDFYNFDILEHAKESGNSWFVNKTKIYYHYPVSYNQVVQIETQLLYRDNKRVVPQGIMFSNDYRKIHAIMWVDFIYVNISSGRPIRHEQELQNLLNQIVLDDRHINDLDFDRSVSEIVKNHRENYSSKNEVNHAVKN